MDVSPVCVRAEMVRLGPGGLVVHRGRPFLKVAMNRTIHMGLSVRGCLRSGEWRNLAGSVRDSDTGRMLTADEIHEQLCDELAQGHEIIPFGEACDAWDWKTGCKGHESTETKGKS